MKNATKNAQAKPQQNVAPNNANVENKKKKKAAANAGAAAGGQAQQPNKNANKKNQQEQAKGQGQQPKKAAAAKPNAGMFCLTNYGKILMISVFLLVQCRSKFVF